MGIEAIEEESIPSFSTSKQDGTKRDRIHCCMLDGTKRDLIHCCMLDGTKRDLILGVYIKRFERAFEYIEKNIRQKLKKQYIKDMINYRRKNKPSKETDKDNKKVLSRIIRVFVQINIFVYEQEKKERAKAIEEQIYAQIDSIPMEYINRKSIEELEEALLLKKKEIDRLLASTISDQILAFPEDSDLAGLKKELTRAARKLIDCVFYKYGEWIDYTNHKVFKDMLDIREAHLKAHCAPHALACFVSYAKMFWYSSLQCNNRFLRELEKDSAAESSSESMAREKSIQNAIQAIEQTVSAHKHIRSLAMYDEIWRNPAVLHLTQHGDCACAPEAYIIYTPGKGTRPRKKVIEWTEKNLEVFRNAQAPGDIEAIAGECTEL